MFFIGFSPSCCNITFFIFQFIPISVWWATSIQTIFRSCQLRIFKWKRRVLGVVVTNNSGPNWERGGDARYRSIETEFFIFFSLHLHVDGGVSVYIFCNMYYRFMIASTALSNSPAQQTKERGVRHAQEQQQPVAAHTIKGIKQYGLGYFWLSFSSHRITPSSPALSFISDEVSCHFVQINQKSCGPRASLHGWPDFSTEGKFFFFF